MRIPTTFFLLLLSASSFAQDDRFSVRGEVELPIQLSNEEFGDIMETVAQLDLGIQKPVWKGLSIGIGGKGTFGVMKDRSIPGTTGDLLRTVFYGKLSYELQSGPNSIFEVSMKVGGSSYAFNTQHAVDSLNNCSGGENQSGFHIDPSISYHLFADDNTAFSFTLGYENDAAIFGPTQVCLDEFPNRTPREPSGNYGYLTIGLGFTAYIGGDRGREGP